MAQAKKPAKSLRKTETMRDKTAKASQTKQKPRRLKRTASAVARPIKAVSELGKREYHIIPQSNKGFWGFLTKSRKLTPSYFRSSVSELKDVTWPNRKTTWHLMIAVFLFAFSFGLVIAVVDFLLDKVFKGVFL